MTYFTTYSFPFSGVWWKENLDNKDFSTQSIITQMIQQLDLEHLVLLWCKLLLAAGAGRWSSLQVTSKLHRWSLLCIALKIWKWLIFHVPSSRLRQTITGLQDLPADCSKPFYTILNPNAALILFLRAVAGQQLVLITPCKNQSNPN